jgi:hypothetical protein
VISIVAYTLLSQIRKQHINYGFVVSGSETCTYYILYSSLRTTFLSCRFPGGVTHSFTGTAEERDKLLSFEKMFIGHFPPLMIKLAYDATWLL